MPGLLVRQRAHDILHAVIDRGQSLDSVLERDPQPSLLEARERAYVRNLVATTLRRSGQIDAVISSRLRHPLPESAVAARNALRLGVCQLLFLRTESHAAVDLSVTLSKRGPHRFVGVVNAVLRQIAREPAEDVISRFPTDLNIPGWLMSSWTETYGEDTARAIGKSLQHPALLDLTVKADPAGWAERLHGKHIWGDTVRVRAGSDITSLPGYLEGAWWVQDLAATLPARLLAGSSGVRSGARVCDLCAAPGGKTAQLAAAGLIVEAVDSSGSRLTLLAENLKRLQLEAGLVRADARAARSGRVFDAVLLDAPCTATGTIRRHPDIPLLKTPQDAARMSEIQRELLHAAINLAAAGAPVVYSVCSLEAQECEQVVDTVLGERSDIRRESFVRADVRGLDGIVTGQGDIRTLPCHLAEHGGMDGFFVSRLRKIL